MVFFGKSVTIGTDAAKKSTIFSSKGGRHAAYNQVHSYLAGLACRIGGRGAGIALCRQALHWPTTRQKAMVVG